MRRILLPLLSALLCACASTAPAPEAATAAAAPVAVRTAPAATDSSRWELDIQAFEREDAVVRRRPGSIVFVGSSSIRLWRSLDTDFPGVAIINRGFGGSRVYDSLHYADRIVTPYQPRAVVFYAGDNDLHEGRTPAQVRDDFVAFVERVRAAAPQARIGFISIKPSPSRAALLPQVREANALVRAYAQQAKGVDYLDVYTPMLQASGAPRPELFLEDALHMNRSGYAIWADVVGAWLGKL
ncbi:SGNH/GDSL hydrolase family protein [Lysobacter sp. 1R34A]|uniref:SGNH/GDSL hydrolase family protein n=1 Tax=Lysobacter sp. 1R34A TaxID=3445786 RepID=UPI003EEC114A